MPRAEPNSFVVLFPVPWEGDNCESLRQIHEEQWQEETSWQLEAIDEPAQEGVRATGAVEGPEGRRAELVVEEPIAEIVEVAGTSKEPYQTSELALLQQQQAIWRMTIEGGEEEGLENAVWALQLMMTFVEAQAGGAFFPALVEMHSPGMIRTQSMSIGHIQPVVNLFVTAWDNDEWMATRGLTAFELPELETVVDAGLNQAFFRLMDVASGMINQRKAYPPGANLEVGHEKFVIEEGRQGPTDEQVPFAGHYGVLTLRPQ